MCNTKTHKQKCKQLCSPSTLCIYAHVSPLKKQKPIHSKIVFEQKCFSKNSIERCFPNERDNFGAFLPTIVSPFIKEIKNIHKPFQSYGLLLKKNTIFHLISLLVYLLDIHVLQRETHTALPHSHFFKDVGTLHKTKVGNLSRFHEELR